MPFTQCMLLSNGYFKLVKTKLILIYDFIKNFDLNWPK